MTRLSGATVELFRSVGLLLTDSVLRRFSPRSVPAASGKKSILLVRLDLIGDFVLWLDAAKGLRQFFSSESCAITLLGNDVWTALAEETGLFDTVVPINRKRLFKDIRYRYGVLAAVRRASYDMVLNPAFSREFLLGDAIVRASGAPVRIGFDGDCSNIRPWQKALSDRWYTRLIPAAAEDRMELERNADFIRELGQADFRAGVPELSIPRMLPAGFSGQNYCVIFPGASYAAKRWPEENFARLADMISTASGWECILCGGPGEELLGDAIRERSELPLENWIGRTSLRELVSIIAGARLVVTNDTSAVHIAAAVGTAVVAVTGGGQPDRFLPYRVERAGTKPLPVVVRNLLPCYGCNWKCEKTGSIHRTAPCIENIRVEDVWQAVVPLLTDRRDEKSLNRNAHS